MSYEVKAVVPVTSLGPKHREVRVEMTTGRNWIFRAEKEKVRLRMGPSTDEHRMEYKTARAAAVKALNSAES